MIKYLLSIFDFFWVIAVLPAALVMRLSRRIGLKRLKLSRRLMLAVGIFPIVRHYYEPQFDCLFEHPLDQDRKLPGIDFNLDGQLEFLKTLNRSGELSDWASGLLDDTGFVFGNGTFESGDAEFWYQLIRQVKPARIYEIGSGNSTRIAIRAIRQNQRNDPQYMCRHLCIEPYEMKWLESSSVELIREKVELLDVSIFQDLSDGDILFIDSSHVIRPQGDVLFEYLDILPILKSGVIVHIHDIFSPKNYPASWLIEDARLWNEQYLFEAFMTQNKNWKVLGALNYLKHKQFKILTEVCPFLTSEREPGSFYIQCIK
jgi:hypothetical protein